MVLAMGTEDGYRDQTTDGERKSRESSSLEKRLVLKLFERGSRETCWPRTLSSQSLV